MSDQTNLHEVDLTTLAYGGAAMGRLADGRAVFVPFGLPGEKVRVRLVEERRGFARAELVEVIDPSPARIRPRCQHFGVCGGCHYQHLPYEQQLQAKTEILIDQLQRIGKIPVPPVQAIVASPTPWNYRNSIQFHLTEAGKLAYITARGDQKMEVLECHLPEPTLNAFWPHLEFEPETEIERVGLRSDQDESLMLLLESDSPEPPDLEIEAGISVTHLFEDHAVVMAGTDHTVQSVLGREFKISAPSFFQVNTSMAEKMAEHLLENLTLPESATLIDIYCGVGLFSAFFAARCERLIGIELSSSACEDFAENLDEFDNVELYEGAAEEVLPALQPQLPDETYVILDPPRAGLDKAVIDALLAMQPTIIAYVSCDPSTLARDAARLLQGGYRLRQVTPFDLFPQTFHIESISFFER